MIIEEEPFLLPSYLLAAAQWESSPAFKFRHYLCIDSTNLEARRDFERGAEELTVYIAESQTAGRGRDGRTWFSPAGGGIYASVLFTPHWAPPNNIHFTYGTAASIYYALQHAIESAKVGFNNYRLSIKSPNDLLLNGSKISGILVESASIQERTQYVVVGFGINVNQQEFPPEISKRATSLKLEFGSSFNRAELLVDVLIQLKNWYDAMRRGDFQSVEEAWALLERI